MPGLDSPSSEINVSSYKLRGRSANLAVAEILKSEQLFAELWGAELERFMGLLLDKGGSFPDKGFWGFVGHDVSPGNQASLDRAPCATRMTGC